MAYGAIWPGSNETADVGIVPAFPPASKVAFASAPGAPSAKAPPAVPSLPAVTSHTPASTTVPAAAAAPIVASAPSHSPAPAAIIPTSVPSASLKSPPAVQAPDPSARQQTVPARDATEDDDLDFLLSMETQSAPAPQPTKLARPAALQSQAASKPDAGAENLEDWLDDLLG
ncbi:hypothetical protein BDK51DRAFT_37123 [Blyttiomyces helicus]|uniref:Uncharacterized protein n=1 Tax=Blyttiomyces helicus TaxID=388810 RepID=A0A4P9WGV6_9FUNG|nr:hypothetical protein BDK51DRAFT_37123 [Blyttiomyces helicus]|eukprot:RKO92039.1 hypothetical protein BDK51DRAFT_37123 [Blyttiomyces helicus]